MARGADIQVIDGGDRVVVSSPRRGAYEATLVGVFSLVALAVYVVRLIASPTAAMIERFQGFAIGLAVVIAILGLALLWRYTRGRRIDELAVRGDELTHVARRGTRVLGERKARLADVRGLHVTHEGAPPSLTAPGMGRRYAVAFQMGDVTRFVGENLPEQDAEELRRVIGELVERAGH